MSLRSVLQIIVMLAITLAACVIVGLDQYYQGVEDGRALERSEIVRGIE